MGIELPTLRIDPRELLQHVSRVAYRGTPLYYGRDGTNRYDDPAKNYGVTYLGRDLPTALMESVFHKHQWDQDTKRSITLAEVQSRLVRAVGVVDALQLADLTAAGVMANYFGLNLQQLASRDYKAYAAGFRSGACNVGCRSRAAVRRGALSVAQQLSLYQHRIVRAGTGQGQGGRRHRSARPCGVARLHRELPDRRRS